MVKRSSYKSNSSDNPDRVRKNSNMRDRSTINRMHMYREGKAKYDRDGKVIGGYLRSTTKTANKEIEGPARIAPNRKWFGNTRTITPEKLDTFREEMAKTVNDPYVECALSLSMQVFCGIEDESSSYEFDHRFFQSGAHELAHDGVIPEYFWSRQAS